MATMVIHWKDKDIPNMETKGAKVQSTRAGMVQLSKYHQGTKSIGSIGRSADFWNPFHHNRSHNYIGR